jgi:hypothetical protein
MESGRAVASSECNPAGLVLDGSPVYERWMDMDRVADV